MRHKRSILRVRLPQLTVKRIVLPVIIFYALVAGAPAQPELSAPQTFPTLMNSAMARMDQAMATPYSGDPDKDFATMMIPHHQGAVEMAEIELRFGHDLILRRLAQGIIVEQRQEIVVMRQALATLHVPVNPAAQAPSGVASKPMAMPMTKPLPTQKEP